MALSDADVQKQASLNPLFYHLIGFFVKSLHNPLKQPPKTKSTSYLM